MEKIPNLTTPGGRQEEINKAWQEGEKNKLEADNKPEFDLEKSRDGYVKSYTEYRQEFGGMKKKDLAEIEKTIEPARKFIKAGDNRLLDLDKKRNVHDRIAMSPEEKQALYDAETRKKDFVESLRNNGIEKEKAEAIYEAELKKAKYDAAKVEVGKKMKEGGATDAEIFKKLILDEKEALNKIKVESWPPKEKGILRKGMEWYMKRGTVTRLLISTGLVTGAVAGVGGFGAAAVATFAGYRFVRGFGSVMIGKLAGMGVDKIMSRGIEAQKEAALEKLKTGFDLTKLKNTEKELEKIFEENAKAERRKMLIKAGVSVVAGAGTAIGMGMLEHAWAGGVKVAPDAIKPNTDIPSKPTVPEAPISETPPTVAAEIKPEILTIGDRGPEGAIIDYFRENPDIAVEKFGCPKELYGPNGEITDVDKFNEWAGGKAHRLWLEDAKKALAKPETLEQLKKLDYSENAEGYAQMMRRIGEGGVEINPETGKIELVDDTEYLKARIQPKTSEIPWKTVPETTSELFPEKIGDFGDYTLLEQDRTLNLLDGNINDTKNNLFKFTDSDVIGNIKGEISRLEDLRGSMLKNPAFLENQNTLKTYLISLERQIGLNLDEYSAIKNVKAGKFLEEISRYKESGEWPDLPSDGSYGAMELQRQVKLAQILDKWKDVDRDLKIEDFIKSKIRIVSNGKT